MPGRTTRGSLPGRLALADAHVQAKLGHLLRQTDELTETKGGSPFGGGALSGEEFRTLVVNDPQFQERLAFRMVFASDKEKAALARALERAYQSGVEAPDPVVPPEVPMGPTGPPPPGAPLPSLPPPAAPAVAPVAPVVQDTMPGSAVTLPPPPLAGGLRP